jgi:hypothetical protein
VKGKRSAIRLQQSALLCVACVLCMSAVAPVFATTTYYVNGSISGNNTNDGLSAASPKKNVSAVLAVANPSDVIEVAAGFYCETNWPPSGQEVHLSSAGRVIVYQGEPPGWDTVGDGITDFWRALYFGGDGSTTNSTSCASCDPDDDGFTNLDEWQIGTDPTDPNSHPSALLTIPNAWAIYTVTSNVEVTADIRSTNQWITVKAAEYFLDSTNGVTFGTGYAMTATDGTFNSTNEIAVGTFTPSFPYGERHEIFIHAQGKDKQWCPFKKVIINPNINDILDKIQANYSQIQNISYTMVVKDFVGNSVNQTRTVLVRQKGAYKFRYEDLSTGALTIINENQIVVRDQNGQVTPMFLVLNDDPSGSTSKNTHFLWDIDRGKTRYDFGSLAPIPNTPGGYSFIASAKAGVATAYGSFSCTTDFRYGSVSRIDYADDGVTTVSLEQPLPQEIAPGVWFHGQQNSVTPVILDWNMRHNEEIQMPTVQINSASMPDSLFDTDNP